MTVLELIEKLKAMPQNMEVICGNPEQVWDDENENFKVIL